MFPIPREVPELRDEPPPVLPPEPPLHPLEPDPTRPPPVPDPRRPMLPPDEPVPPDLPAGLFPAI